MRRAAILVAVAAALALSVLTTLVVVHCPVLVHLDGAIAHHARELARAHPGHVWFTEQVTSALRPLTWTVLGTALGLLLLLRRHLRHGCAVLLATAVGGTADTLGKALVDRDRPIGDYLVPHANRYTGDSFPSGHAVAATVGVGLVLMVGIPLLANAWRHAALVAAVITVMLVGGTRIALNVHWASDVIGGWLAGVLIVSLTLAIIGPPQLPRSAALSRFGADTAPTQSARGAAHGQSFNGVSE